MSPRRGSQKKERTARSPVELHGAQAAAAGATARTLNVPVPLPQSQAQEKCQLICFRALSGPTRFCLVPVFPLFLGWGKLSFFFSHVPQAQHRGGHHFAFGKPHWALSSESVFVCSLVNPLLKVKCSFVQFQ